MAVSDTLIGSVFDGRYRIERKLGAGGMADVYLAEDQELGRRVAIKILNDRHAADDSFIERFRREAKNAAGLSHPNIVSIYDRGEAEGTYYIAMEFLDGRSLKELIVGRGPAPVKVAIDYTRQILAAVGFAHKHGIVHRDIKPHNVLVGPEGRLKVTDFGIARSGASQMTEVGSIIGTAQYLSPEQARGARVDQTSDLYSVGVVLYEMLTGQVPFTGDTPLEIAMKHLSEVPAPPSELRPEVPHDLDSVVLRALAKDPADRYQSAEEMDDDLARVAQGLPVDPDTETAATAVLAGAGVLAAAAPTSVLERPTEAVAARTVPPSPPAGYYGYEGPPRRRRPIWPWILSILLLAAAGAAAWFAYTKIQDQLAANKPVAVPPVVGIQESLAVRKINDAGLQPTVHRRSSTTVQKGDVIDQSPAAGTKVQKNQFVDITVSKGLPTVQVPSVVGKSRDDAISTLVNAGLTAQPVVSVPSSKPVGTVTGQDPPSGQVVTRGSNVRINVSSGPAEVDVPSVVGLPFDEASAALQNDGFAVARTNVDSNSAKDTVVDQSPSGTAPKGATITLSVSKGPKQSTVPDVTNQDQASAQSALQSAGFNVKVTKQDVNDPGLEGIVLSETPQGGTKADQGSTVTLTVGRLVQSGPTGPGPPAPPPPPA
jgi:serine/threonine-protein kinase